MSFTRFPEEITENDIIEVVDTFTKTAPDASNPHGMTALAVKAQSAQVVLTGFQALATLRVARAIEALVHRFEDATEAAAKAGDAAGILKEGLEAIRKQLSSNGS